MWDIRWDIDKVPGLGDEMLIQIVAIPHAGLAAENVNRGFVTSVLMRLAPGTGRDRRDLQINPAGTCGLSRNPGRVHRPILACELLPGGKDSAGGLAAGGGCDRLCLGHLLRLLCV